MVDDGHKVRISCGCAGLPLQQFNHALEASSIHRHLVKE